MGYDGPILPCANKAKRIMKVINREFNDNWKVTVKLCVPCGSIFERLTDDMDLKRKGKDDGGYITIQFKDLKQ